VTGAAFFDLDRTVVSQSSMVCFGKAALRWGLYSRRQLLRHAWKNRQFFRRSGDEAQRHAMCNHLLAAVTGWRRSDVDRMAPDILAPLLAHVHPEMYRRILEHEALGVPTFLCSASPIEIVERMGQVLNMHGVVATVAETDANGVYTGELSGPFCHGEGKFHAVQALAADRGIDLSQSWAYSDSVSDLPLFEAVGMPVAVNPDDDLRAIAKERDWEILNCEIRRLPWVVAAGMMVGVTSAACGLLWRTTR